MITAATAFNKPLPMSVTMAMARISAGNERTISMMRMRVMSVQPEAKPAMAPTMAPTMMAKPTTAGPMGSEMRAP